MVLTYLCLIILPRLGFIDKPGGRHIHDTVVPRGGGIAVIIAFFVVLALYIVGHLGSVDGDVFWRLFLPALPLTLIGLLDDRFDVKSWLKLLAQILVVVVAWPYVPHSIMIFGWMVPPILTFGILLVWVIIIVNAFNLIDGLDGLASGLAIVSSVCMALWFLLVGGHRSEAMCMLILAGACLGFLRYNFYPAKIFLGDTGSTFLGLVFAITGLSAMDKVVTMTSLLLPVLAIGVPLFDVVLAIWRRSARKLLNPGAGGIMDGDQDHLHHRLFRQNQNQTKTAFIMYLIGCAFAAIALLLLTLGESSPAIAYVTLLIAVLVMIRQLAVVELLDSAILFQRGLSKPRKGIFVNMIHPFIDFFMIAISYVVTSVILIGHFQDFSLFLCMFVPIAMTLMFSRVYRIYWLRAGLNNYWHLALVIALGSVLSCFFVYLFQMETLTADYGINERWLYGACLLFGLLNITLISLERFLLHYAEGFWFRKMYLQYGNEEGVERILIYGGGLKCRIYVNYIYCAQRTDYPKIVIGILDDDPVLHGLRVYGFKVLGSARQIEPIYAKRPFDKIVIAIDTVQEYEMNILNAFCEKNNIKLLHLAIAEKGLDDAPVSIVPLPAAVRDNVKND
jgi:UDP-N-acetylmuramyl pentapeptide phosphotransferase/UDP-N-acetylglucosamine-1-phosphate transferase